jgi:hypothetical protein
VLRQYEQTRVINQVDAAKRQRDANDFKEQYVGKRLERNKGVVARGHNIVSVSAYLVDVMFNLTIAPLPPPAMPTPFPKTQTDRKRGRRERLGRRDTRPWREDACTLTGLAGLSHSHHFRWTHTTHRDDSFFFVVFLLGACLLFFLS